MDKKDSQILALQAMNCRLSHTAIGSAVRLSKDAVRHRLERLEQQGLLTQHMLFIDARKLGFTRYHLLLQFDTSIVEKKDYANRVKKHPAAMWVNTFIGKWELQIIIDARDGFELHHIQQELFELGGVGVKDFLILTHLYDFEFTQLVPELRPPKLETKNDASFSGRLFSRGFAVEEAFDTYLPDARERLLLHALADDPRRPLTEIATLTSMDRQTAKRHIERLIDRGIILNFGGIPSLPAMGYVTYYLLLRFEQGTQRSVMKKPFELLENIFYAGRMVGDYDMIVYLNAKSPQELNESVDLFKRELGKHIQTYDLLIHDGVQHWRQYTDAIHNALE